MTIQTVNEVSRIDVESLIRKHRNERYQWEQDFNANHQAYALQLAQQMFTSFKLTFEEEIKTRELKAAKKFEKILPLDILKTDSALPSMTKSINLEPFKTWFSKELIPTRKFDAEYFNNLMTTVGKLAVTHLTGSFKNYFTPDFEFTISIDDEDSDEIKNEAKRIKMTVWRIAEAKIPTQSQLLSKNQSMVKFEQTKAQWQRQCNENYQAFSSELAKSIFKSYKMRFENTLASPYEKLKINEKYKVRFRTGSFHNNKFLGDVAQSTKLEPFYQWNTQIQTARNNSVYNYFHECLGTVLKTAVTNINDRLKNYLTSDFNFRVSIEEDDADIKLIAVEVCFVSDPDQIKKKPAVLMDKNDPTLLVKKNN